MKSTFKILLLTLLIIVQLPGSDKRDKKIRFAEMNQSNFRNKPMRTMLNVNDFTSWFYASGTSANDPNGDAGGFFPRGTAGVIFTDGLIWGGFVADSLTPLRVGGVTYYEGVRAGRILPSGQAQDPEHPEVRIYRIRKDYQQMSDADLRQDTAELLLKDDDEVTESEMDSIFRQYDTDWQEWPVQLGAPFYDLNGNGIYEPETGESPGLQNADQVIWFVCNDISEQIKFGIYGSPPFGFELQVTAWAYYSPDIALNSTLFRKNRIINKGLFTVDSLFLGLWSDVDIGNYTDDFVGCDSMLGLAYGYSSTGLDHKFAQFDLYSPAVGYTIMNEEEHSPTSSCYFSPPANFESFLGDYDGTLAMYNWLNGYQAYVDINNPTPYQFKSGPQKGRITKFPLSGDPVTGTGDIDGEGNNYRPGDRSILLSSGPLKFNPGDTLEVIDARIGGYGTAYHPYAVEWLKTNVRQIKAQYPNYFTRDNFSIPQLYGIATEGEIHIDWGANQDLIFATEQRETGNSFKFEGYNVWQLPDENSSVEDGIKIATYDLPTQPRIIMGYEYDPASGILINRPLAYGSNSGIQRFLTISRDSLNQQNLIDGQPYHFAVTAYYYSDLEDLPFPLLESEPGRITIRAQNSNPGYKTHSGDTLSVIHVGRSHGTVTPIVINPSALTGHSYQISFSDATHWSLTDITKSEIKAENQTNLSGDFNYPTIDGILPIVIGSEYTRLSGWDYDGNRWVSGYQWGGQEFFGGLDIGHRFMGSTLDTLNLTPVRLEFQDQAGVDESGFISEGAVYHRHEDYAHASTGQLPFAAYDIVNPDQPRRLNICFVEDDREGATGQGANLIWDMGWNGHEFGSMGAREYIFIMNSTYDGGINYSNSNNGTQSDVLFAIWPQARGSRGYLLSEFTMDIEVEIANTPQDIFTFTAPDADKVPNRFQVYQNFPNPFNNSTTIRYWLPVNNLTKMEIFDIRGRKVDTPVNQVQDQGEYHYVWQPGNIASGLYFCKLSSGSYTHQMKINYIK